MDRMLTGDLESVPMDADFSKLVAQQVAITQSMMKRHQDLVSSLRTEIEVLRNELFDKDCSQNKSHFKSPHSPHDPVTSSDSFALNGSLAPVTPTPSVPTGPLLANMEDITSKTDTQELAVVPAVKPRVSLKVKPFLADDEDEAAMIGKVTGRSRSPNQDWRSMSNDTFYVRGRKSEQIPKGRSSLISGSDPRPSRSMHGSSVHANAAARARTAESQRNAGRSNSKSNTSPNAPGGVNALGPRVISAPDNVGGVNVVAVEIRVEPWEFWQELAYAATVEERRASMHSYSAQKSRLSLKDGKNKWETDLKTGKILQAMVLPPDGKRRLFWLVFSLLLIAYDMVMVPLSVFELDTSSFETAVTVFSATFWTIDFILAFFVGYYVSGSLELRPHMTALNYMKTWMMADLILLAFEWTDVIISEMPSLPSLIRASRSLRILRFLRSAKLLRAAKLPSFMKSIPFISRSEYITLSLGILKQLLFILFINHTIASVWYLLGQNNGWLYTYEIPTNDWWYTYLITLHWSLTQFTPASMTVQPTNIHERGFNVAVVIFALVTFSSFVSSITNLMTHLRNLESAEAIMFSKLEDFMQSRKFSFYLTVRVRRYLEQRLAEKRSKPEEGDIILLERLSEPLKMEVHFEMHSPTLTKHALFFAYSRLNEPAVMKLCHSAVKTILLSGEDYLFAKGETAKSMFFVLSGSLTYTMEIGAPTPVQAPAFFTEMVLWAPWSHNGTMRAKTDCKILLLDAEKFHDVVFHAQNCQLEVCKYAERAIHILNKYFNKDTRTDLNCGKYNERRMVKKVFPEGCLDVRPMWFMPPRSINRHNSTGGMLGNLRRQLSAQVEELSDSDSDSSDSDIERFGVPKRIMEDNERDVEQSDPPQPDPESDAEAPGKDPAVLQ